MNINNNNLIKFRQLFDTIPSSSFPSVLLYTENIDDNAYIKISDIDINHSLIFSGRFKLDNTSDVEDVSYRIPLSKNVERVIHKSTQLTFAENSILGFSKNKEVSLATFINQSQEIDFPTNINDMLKMTKEMNDIDDVLYTKIDLTKELIDDILECIDSLSVKKFELKLDITIDSKKNKIVIAAKDTGGNNFKYTIDDIETKQSYKVKYDDYFYEVIKTLSKIKGIDSFECIISNLIFGVSFVLDDVEIMIAITAFEKR